VARASLPAQAGIARDGDATVGEEVKDEA